MAAEHQQPPPGHLSQHYPWTRTALIKYRPLCISGFDIRLADGTMPSEGRVEISYNGKWGTICDSFWSDNDARVVCRQLGYLDGVAQANSFYGSGIGPSWLYYVRCDGDENSIWSCTNSGFNVSNTSCRNHQYDASVYCTGRGKHLYM